MSSDFGKFERLSRLASNLAYGYSAEAVEHPFESRNIHERIAEVSRDLFDNGHFSQATFEAWKLVDGIVQSISCLGDSGFKLMMQAFADNNPPIKLNFLITQTERDEQKGFQFLFAGGILAIRNPRGHIANMKDDPDTCLDHLSLASFLLRKLESVGNRI